MSFYAHDCEHLEGPEACGDCRREQGEIHKAAVRIRYWATAIEEISSRARACSPDFAEEREALLLGIDGLSWAIRHKAEFDIENETCQPGDEETSERPDGPRLISSQVEAP